MVLALGRLAIGGLLLSAISLAPSAPASTHINSTPLIPSTRLEFGIASQPSDLSWMASSGVPWKYRYTYLAGGVNTGNGWETWNSPAGAYATYYMDASNADGYVPVLPYYELLQSSPSTGSNESDRDFSNLNNTATMSAYYANFKLLMQKAGAFGQTVIVHVEPDLWGYLEQRAGGGDASTLTASVKSSGFADVSAVSDTAQGFAWALLHIRDLYAPNALLATHASLWASGYDVGSDRSTSLNPVTVADATSAFLNSAGIASNPYGSTWDLVFNDVDDHDAAWWEAQGANNAYFTHWWDPTNAAYPNFTRYLSWVAEMHIKTGKQLVVWQVPEGNQYFLAENNTCGHYQDTIAQYFIAHASDLYAAGLVAVLFGAGNACQTNNTDARFDGITNNGGSPTTDLAGWCNACNVHAATFADDDGGFLRMFVGQYYAPVPGAPTNVTATAGDGSASVSWSAPANSGGSAISSYVVTAHDGCTIQGSVTVPGAPPATTTTFPSLTNGTAYTFTVAAVNSYGAGAQSVASNVVIPIGAAPTWLTACSTSQYSLSGSDGLTWKALDAVHLSLTFTSSSDSWAVITGNADLWTTRAGYNQDLGIAMNSTVVAWKESGGFAGIFSPNAATVQTAVHVTSGVTYTVQLQWKANRADPGAIFAGAGPLGTVFSPTRLTVQLVPVAAALLYTKSITSQPCLLGNDGSTWVDLDPALSIAFTPPSGSWTALISGNADMFTSTAGYNQDLGIAMTGGVYSSISAPEAWKESGGNAGTYSPNAAFVQAALPVSGGTSYTARLVWKANHGSSGWIHIGAGPVAGAYSPTRITVLLVPLAGSSAAGSISQYVLHNSDGATWQAMDGSALKITLSPGADTSYAISAGADLWTASAGFNQDVGIMVSGGAYGTGTLVAWKESGGYAGTFSPNAAFVTTDLHLQTGVTYTVWVVWKANRAGPSNIYAGAGPIGGAFSPASITSAVLSQP